MTRIQVLLSDSQNEKLSYLAKRLKTTKSKLIREAVDMILVEKVSESDDPLLELIGQAGDVGAAEISETHDNFLVKKEREKWQKGRSS